jgi:molybdate transport system substrate-binding protein
MRRNALSVVLLALLLTACNKSSTPRASSGPVKLTVFAAARLDQVLPRIGELFTIDHAGVTLDYTFGSVDDLAAKLQQGEPADVFVGSYTHIGDQLASANVIDAYKVFCTNQLVLITPSANPAGITTVQELSTKPVKLVIASEESIPLLGSYTRTVLTNLDAVYGSGYSAAVLQKVVSNEDTITSILEKVQSGEADAGFVQKTDAAGADVNFIELPAEADAVDDYPIAVVKKSKNRVVAQQFVDFVLTAPAQTLLQDAGFGPPPSPTS